MKTGMLSALAALLFFGATAEAHVGAHLGATKLCRGFLPPNHLRNPVDDKAVTGLTEAQFDSVLNRIFPLYKDEIHNRGGQFVIDRKWAEAEVNAYADRDPNRIWVIHMYGGLARHPGLTVDGFALVACHEVGHHLGGAPKYGASSGSAWAANEGQADYYATLKCLHRYFAGDNNERIVAAMNVDPSVAASCRSQHHSRSDRAVCMRASMAGYSLSSLFKDLSDDGPIAFTTPDPHQVLRTDNDHPASQCRLDTYFHGALCNVPVGQALSDSDYRPGSCYDVTSQAAGLRPRCWFLP